MNLLRWVRRTGEWHPQFEMHCRQLHDEGFTRVRSGFPKGAVSEVLESVKRVLRQNQHIFGPHIDADGHYPRIINLHMAHRPLLRLFTENPLALAVQDAFFGSPSAIYTSLYYERGSAQSTHRDTPYFSTKPEYRYLGVWVALEDADESNGCLEVIRKGHLVPELDRAALALGYYKNLDEVPPGSPAGEDVLWDAYQAKVLDACEKQGLKRELVRAQAGDVVIWHPQLPHGGSRIANMRRTRHSFVMHVTPVGTPVYQQDVFFNPEKQAPDVAPWAYDVFDRRRYARLESVDIGHHERRGVAEFVR